MATTASADEGFDRQQQKPDNMILNDAVGTASFNEENDPVFWVWRGNGNGLQPMYYEINGDAPRVIPGGGRADGDFFCRGLGQRLRPDRRPQAGQPCGDLRFLDGRKQRYRPRPVGDRIHHYLSRRSAGALSLGLVCAGRDCRPEPPRLRKALSLADRPGRRLASMS
jgi:hypothetical protein